MRDRAARRLVALPLAWQIFLPTAIFLVAALLALALTPTTVSYPIGRNELLLLAVGLLVLLAVNAVVIRRAISPLAELVDAMRRVELLLPGQRVSIDGASTETEELGRAFNMMLARLEAEQREGARRMLLGQEEERRRLARGLHDELNQTITAVMLRLQSLVGETDGGVASELDGAQRQLRSLTVEVENVINALRPETLDDLGLIKSLVALCDQFSEDTGIAVERRFDRGLPSLPAESELVVYRVAQESLTNVARHSAASTVLLTLERSGNEAVRLKVRDDGVGIGGAREGNGIRGMRERALLVDGSLEVGNATRGPGAEVRLRIPVPFAP